MLGSIVRACAPRALAATHRAVPAMPRAASVAVPLLQLRASAAPAQASRWAHGTVVQQPAVIPVTFVTMEGERWEVEGQEGETLLETINRYDLPVPGMCNGGGLGPDRFSDGPMCRSCHVYVDHDHLQKLPPKSQDESELTDWIENKTANSRFACEIVMDKSLSGMTVVIPDYPERQ